MLRISLWSHFSQKREGEEERELEGSLEGRNPRQNSPIILHTHSCIWKEKLAPAEIFENTEKSRHYNYCCFAARFVCAIFIL